MRHTQDTSTMAVTHTIFLSLSSSVLEYNWLPQFELVVRVQGDSPLTLFLQWHDDSFQIFSLRHSRLSSCDLRFFPFDLLFVCCATFRQEKGKGGIPLNSYNQLTAWQPIIFEYMGTWGKEKLCVSYTWYFYLGYDAYINCYIKICSQFYFLKIIFFVFKEVQEDDRHNVVPKIR